MQSVQWMQAGRKKKWRRKINRSQSSTTLIQHQVSTQYQPLHIHYPLLITRMEEDHSFVDSCPTSPYSKLRYLLHIRKSSVTGRTEDGRWQLSIGSYSFCPTSGSYPSASTSEEIEKEESWDTYFWICFHLFDFISVFDLRGLIIIYLVLSWFFGTWYDYRDSIRDPLIDLRLLCGFIHHQSTINSTELDARETMYGIGLWIMDYGLRITDHGSRTYRLRITEYYYAPHNTTMHYALCTTDLPRLPYLVWRISDDEFLRTNNFNNFQFIYPIIYRSDRLN